MLLRPILLMAGLTACGAGPVLISPAPAQPGSFSLADSGAVVRRVQEVFACAATPSALPFGTLGWRRDSGFVDVTIVQEIAPAMAGAAPGRSCYKGFRVDAEGKIFALPEKDWPYTAFQKRPPRDPRL